MTTSPDQLATATPGPAAPREGGVLRPLPLRAVALDPAGALGAWQVLNHAATIPHCIANVESSGVLDNLRRVVGRSDAEFRGFWFQDTDLHKTLEAIGWDVARTGEDPWAGFVDEALELLNAVQAEDGYLDSYVQGSDQPRWEGLRWSHELYNAGHLIQAAVAFARAGDGRLLEVARKFADLLVRELGEGGLDAIDGHPEVETALVELYRETGHEPYLRLAQRQVELRGKGLLGHDRFGAQYFQDHAPVREATEAIGHSVRQLYLAAGVTDIYLETGDESLLKAMRQLWDSAFGTKAYVTGAHGSRHRDEAYGDPYELPTERAYAETCASIAAFQWNWRMLLATGEARYAEEMERALYNAIAVSTAADGKHFFYSNPLQQRTGHDGSTEDSPSERLSWYACACCPPNLARLVASIQSYLATSSERGVQLQLLTAGTVSAPVPGGVATINVRTGYPWRGDVTLEVSGGREPWELAVRIPAWCTEPSISVDGRQVAEPVGSDGYLRITRDWSAGATVQLDLPLPVRAVRAHSNVDAVRGQVAIARGPVLFCLEQVDLPEDVVLEDVRIDPARLPQPREGEILPGAPLSLVGTATAVTGTPGALYGPEAAVAPNGTREIEVTAIPYFRWANRGPVAMRVWIPTV